MKNTGYSIFRSNGSWFVRWSEYRDRKRIQPSHKLCNVKHYPKESEVRPLAEAYMLTVRRTMTIEAGASVKEFVDCLFLPKSRERLSRNTVLLYKQAWRRLEPHLGNLRLRDVRVCDVQNALDRIQSDRGDELGHYSYMHCKVTCSAIFSHALRLGHHPGPNPENGTTVRGYGHNNHRKNGAYTLDEIKQFLKLFPAGPVAVAIAMNAFLALRRPEVEALLPEDYDREREQIRIHRNTKTGNDEWLPVVSPLAKLLTDGWGKISLRRSEYEICKKIAGTNLTWKGWYAFRRGLATNLYRCGMQPEQACLILRNSADVVRKHYIRLEEEGIKVDAMSRLERAYEHCATGVQ